MFRSFFRPNRSVECLAAFLVLCALLVPGRPAQAEAPEIVKVRTSHDFYYIAADHRYTDNFVGFHTGRMEHGVQMLNSAVDGLRPHIPVYCYLAESSRSHPITPTFPADSLAYRFLLKFLHADHFDHLKYETYQEFCQYFYQTDHHWNYLGSYQGYTDMIRMMLGDDEPLFTPDETVVLPVVFQGSFANKEKHPIADEPFAFYRFDHLPAYTTYINDARRSYGNMRAYLAGRYATELYTNHYEQLYGGSWAKIVYDTGRPEKKDLLVFCNSYGSPVRPLLASHYNRTVFIDLRLYYANYGENVSLNEIVREYGIDQILFLGDVKMFIDVKHIVR